MIMYHLIRMQVFYTDDTEVVHDRPRMLMGKVLAPPGGTLMYTCHHLAPLVMPLRVLFSFGEATLCFGKTPLFRMEEARIVNLLLVGECSESLESDINANLLRN